MADISNSTISSYGATTELNRINTSLTTGQRINQAADNPAGLAITMVLTSQINQQDMALQNANNGIGLLQTADSASASIGEYLQRMNELAIQAQNGTINESQRNLLNSVFQQGLESINQIAENTSFNDIPLLNGQANGVDINLGDSNMILNLANQTATALGIDGLNILSANDAEAALENIGNAITSLNEQRANNGAQQNGLLSSASALQSQNQNTQAARSQTLDTDMAQAVAEQLRANMLEDANIMMQAQSNQSRASVLQLLNS